jgi:hypothetical protein
VLAIFMVPVFFVAVMDFFSRKGTTPRLPGAETAGETPPTLQLAEGQDARS